jgi:dTDP-4-dehydrorhamnose reductase
VSLRRVAVTGANGRLGRAAIIAVTAALGPDVAIGWSRPDLDLDDPVGLEALVARDAPDAVIHAAAWTDVDGCAREPAVALRRNGDATAALARACARHGVRLVAVSTNEVFDGLRTDGRGYAPDDAPAPGNPYGASKLAGEEAAAAAFAGREGDLAIVRTAWLFGPPGRDFPTKIIAAAQRARAASEPLRVVGDEFGSPTSAADLARAIVELIESGELGRTCHYVNSGAISRADWAREVLRLTRIRVAIEEAPAETWPRASTPPRWGVLEPSPLPSGERMRPWTEALAEYASTLRRVAASTATLAAGR